MATHDEEVERLEKMLHRNGYTTLVKQNSYIPDLLMVNRQDGDIVWIEVVHSQELTEKKEKEIRRRLRKVKGHLMIWDVSIAQELRKRKQI